MTQNKHKWNCHLFAEFKKFQTQNEDICDLNDYFTEYPEIVNYIKKIFTFDVNIY